MVLGAFLRGPLIIFVHIVGKLYPKLCDAGCLGRRWFRTLSEQMTGRRLADLGNGGEKRGGMLENLAVCVRREISSVLRLIRIGAGLEPLPGATRSHAIARCRRTAERRRRDPDDIPGTRHAIRG